VQATLFVRDACPFSSLAIERLVALAQEDERVVFEIRSLDREPSRAGLPVVTPTLVLPDGRRVTGTPSLERLRGLLTLFLGAPLVPNKVWFLERNRLFNGVPLDEIEKMAHLFREADYPPNHVIFDEGDLGDAVYLLKTGHVRIYRITEDGQEATLAVLGPGDMFGELALFDERQRLTVAQTMDSAHICAASVDDFGSLMRHRPQLTMMVAREIARRRTASETRIAGTAYATVRGRVVAVLRHLAEEHGERRADGTIRIGIRFSHQQIASFAGATREACSTQISRLQRAGVLQTDATHHFVIPNLDGLQIGAIDRLIHSAVG
jgi:CRP/FNR family cyclic AMP-dependent transcriptional regulator